VTVVIQAIYPRFPFNFKNCEKCTINSTAVYPNKKGHRINQEKNWAYLWVEFYPIVQYLWQGFQVQWWSWRSKTWQKQLEIIKMQF
jgi:hypothetical protein